MRTILAIICILGLALSGCTSSNGTETGTDSGTSGTSASSGIRPGTGIGNQTVPPAPMSRDLYLTSTGGLSWDKPEAGSITSPFNAGQMGTGIVPMEFTSEALPNAVLVPGGIVHLTLWVEGGAGLASNSQLDVGSWFGGTKGMHVSDYATFPAPAIAPNTPVQLSMVMEFGTQSSLLVPAGDQIRAMLVVGGDYAANMAKILVGGEHASRLNVTFMQLAAAPAKSTTETSTPLSGTAQGGPAMIQCTAAPDVLRQHPIDVPANVTRIHVTVEATGTGHTDIDLRLLDGTQLLGSALTPLSKEGIFLGGPDVATLAGKTLSLEVHVCGGTQVTYQGTVAYA